MSSSPSSTPRDAPLQTTLGDAVDARERSAARMSTGVSGDAMTMVVGGETVTLFADRALFWTRERTLFVADVHLGKTATFRAHGVPLPRGTTALPRRTSVDRSEHVVGCVE